VNNLSPETIYNYELDLKVFQLFLNEEAKISDFNGISKKTIELYKAYMASKDRKTAGGQKAQGNLASGSLNRCLSSLRGYLKYLIEMDYEAVLAKDKDGKTPVDYAKLAYSARHESLRLLEVVAYVAGKMKKSVVAMGGNDSNSSGGGGNGEKARFCL